MADGRDDDLMESEALLKGLVDDSRRFFRDLLESNRQLRGRAAAQEERLTRLSEELAEARRRADRVAGLERENDSLTRELAGLRERYGEIEFEHQDFAVRCQQIEEQYAVVANLYVATYQLHATVLYAEVLSVAKEIIANLIGVKRMRLFLRTRKNELLLAAELDLPAMTGKREGKGDPSALADPLLATAMAEGRSHYRTAGQTDGAVAVIPIRIRKTVVGLLVIDELLAHKPLLTEADQQLFELLGGHLAVAIARSHRKAAPCRPTPSLVDQEFDFSSLLLVH